MHPQLTSMTSTSTAMTARVIPNPLTSAVLKVLTIPHYSTPESTPPPRAQQGKVFAPDRAGRDLQGL